jgi:hypothetical protein
MVLGCDEWCLGGGGVEESGVEVGKAEVKLWQTYIVMRLAVCLRSVADFDTK